VTTRTAFKPKLTFSWRFIGQIILVSVGAVIAGIAVIVFEAPFNIAPGGISGLGIILNYLFGIPIGLFILLGNIPIQLIAYRMLGGWKVVAWTIYVLIIYSASIDLLTPYFPPQGIADDIFLNALFGGIVGGIGAGLIYRGGGTLGGTSTLGRILQQKYGIPLSSSSLYTDTAVIFAAGLIFGWASALYAMVALFVAAAVSDYVLEGPSVIRTAVIITDSPRSVADGILEEMGRGVTGWDARGMYTEHKHTVLYVTIGRAQVNELRKLVFSLDPYAFVVIGQGHSAYGHGFKETKAPQD
jgi:uncharacterized membrane-anchored protein YitT (DUF2179 family)